MCHSAPQESKREAPTYHKVSARRRHGNCRHGFHRARERVCALSRVLHLHPGAVETYSECFWDAVTIIDPAFAFAIRRFVLRVDCSTA